MKRILNYFLQGLLYIVPISVTLYVVYWGFIKVDGILPFKFPGLGLIVIFLLITIIGYLGSLLIKSPFSSFFQKVLEKAPLLKTIYTSVKDLMKAFVGKKRGFTEPVLVKLYENSTIERIGFVTNKDIGSLDGGKEKILVYLPHSYAFSGQLFVVEKSYVRPIDSSSGEIMKLIVSGGVTEMEDNEN
tara:strand:+ start:1123 stop:1683 length:561 start_codon:yes stop_codon:yes gene_type:complete